MTGSLFSLVIDTSVYVVPLDFFMSKGEREGEGDGEREGEREGEGERERERDSEGERKGEREGERVFAFCLLQ
jgi:hypothetical protein